MQLRTDAATILTVLSVLISAANWLGILRWLVFKKHFSAIPILGGAFGVVGILIAPSSHAMSAMRAFFWLPLFWDYGSVPLFALNLFMKRRGQKQKAPDDNGVK